MEGEMTMRFRHSLGLTIFRALKPLLRLRSAMIQHEDARPSPYLGLEVRDTSLRQATGLETPSQLLGTEIRLRRLEVGWTQAELAQQAGIAPTHLSRIEHGRTRIRPRMLARILAALDTKKLVRDFHGA
jgi:DNA-binding XRE family transcriptional regulator